MRFSGLAVMLAAVAMLAGCRTNETLMNDAYTKAVQGGESAPPDSTVYMQIRHQMKHGTMTVNGDTVDISTQWCSPTKDEGGDRTNFHRYNVVVGQFKQIFNARSMRERLIADGYEGTFLVNTSEPYYFVVVGSYDDAAEAVARLNEVRQDKRLVMKSPLPFILSPYSR